MAAIFVTQNHPKFPKKGRLSIEKAVVIYMKKLSVVLLLVLCITIGGVYANWIYAGTNAGDLHHHMANIVLTDIDKQTKIGTYSIVQGDDTIKIKIDQKASGDYDTVLSVTGSITITFTPNALYTGDAPTAYFTLASVNDVTTVKFNDDEYTGETNGDRSIFSKFDKSTQRPLTFQKVGDVYEAVITNADITSLMAINTFNLPTITAYDDFTVALRGIGQIGIDIKDTTVID